MPHSQQNKGKQQHRVKPHHIEKENGGISRQAIHRRKQHVCRSPRADGLPQKKRHGAGAPRQLEGDDQKYRLRQQPAGKEQDQRGEGAGKVISEQAEEIHSQPAVPGIQETAPPPNGVVQSGMVFDILLRKVGNQDGTGAEGGDPEQAERGRPDCRGQQKSGNRRQQSGKSVFFVPAVFRDGSPRLNRFRHGFLRCFKEVTT